MGGHYVTDAIVFLVSTLFSLYITAVLLRLLLGWVRADFYNPISMILVKVTNPLLVPLRRVIPGYGGFDWAAAILLIALQFLELTVICFIVGQPHRMVGTLVWAIAELLALTLNVFLFSIIIEALLSWFNPGANPLERLLYRLNYPLLNPVRRRMPPLAGLDLSPLVVIIALQFLSLLLVAPLQGLGHDLALG